MSSLGFRQIEVRFDGANSYVASIIASRNDVDGRILRAIPIDNGESCATDFDGARLWLETGDDPVFYDMTLADDGMAYECPMPSSVLSEGDNTAAVSFFTGSGDDLSETFTRQFTIIVESDISNVLNDDDQLSIMQARDYMLAAQEAAQEAASSASSAGSSESNAASSASSAASSASEAASSATAAASSASAAATSESNAANSAAAAAESASQASQSVDLSGTAVNMLNTADLLSATNGFVTLTDGSSIPDTTGVIRGFAINEQPGGTTITQLLVEGYNNNRGYPRIGARYYSGSSWGDVSWFAREAYVDSYVSQLQSTISSQASTISSLQSQLSTAEGTIEELRDDMEWHPGDSYTVSSTYAFGYLTSSGTALRVGIPLSKPMGSDVSGYTLSNIICTARCNGTYIVGSSSGAASMDDFTVSGTGYTQTGGILKWEPTITAYSAGNNMPVGVVMSFTVTFN